MKKKGDDIDAQSTYHESDIKDTVGLSIASLSLRGHLVYLETIV